MIKSLLAAATIAMALAGATATAEAKMMKPMAKPAVAMCYHTVKGKKHWHPCRMKTMHPHMMMHHHHMMMKKPMKKM